MQHDDSTARDHEEPREGGQAMVEFALVLPVLCLVLFAVIEFGLAFWTYQQVSAAASEGARRAAVSRTMGPGAAAAAAEQAARNASPNLEADQMDVDVVSGWNAGDTVTVSVRYPQDITVMGVTFFDNDLVGRRTMRVEQ